MDERPVYDAIEEAVDRLAGIEGLAAAVAARLEDAVDVPATLRELARGVASVRAGLSERLDARYATSTQRSSHTEARHMRRG